MQVQVRQTVEAYLDGLQHKNLSRVPFAEHVQLREPGSEPVVGASRVRGFLEAFLPMLLEVRLERHIIDGEWCATVMEQVAEFGSIPVVHCIHVQNGRIVSIRIYFDRRAIIEASARE